jgi:sulfatase maturation enzyme AslB (radical SAM superfamily)
MNNKSKTFCILPWTHIASYTDGSALLCCVANSRKELNLNKMSLYEVWNSNYFKESRKLMLSGKRVKECAACYNVEKAGMHSHRQIENHIWENKLGREHIEELISHTEDDGTLNVKWTTLDLRLGNTCNLQCIMCRPVDSSKWVKHATILKQELKTDAKWDWKHKIENYSIDNFEWYKNKTFLKDFYDSANSIRHIIFGGGEPLYIKEHKEILQKLVELGYSNQIELRYHTNGTIYDEEIIELWSKFKFVDVMISIDGVKEINDYIRYPSDWGTIEQNLKKYDNTPAMIDVKILCTVQILNVFFLPEFINWLSIQKFKKISQTNLDGTFHPGILQFPQYLCIKSLPKEFKNKVSEKIFRFAESNTDNPSIQRMLKIISFMNAEDWSNQFNQTLEYLEKMDQLRNTDSSFFRNITNA